MRRYGLVLLSSAPAAVALELLAPERHTALFFASILAIVPLAGYIGRAADELADHF
jgi:Ca2+:H+ antiporter